MRYFIFDLDGCISDDRHRLHLLPDKSDPNLKPRHFNAYNELASEDAPMNKKVFEETLEFAREAGYCQIAFITARPEKYIDQTHDWLRRHFDLEVFEYSLFMRDAGDMSPSPVMKVRALTDRGIAASEVIVAYDDRKDVLQAYRDYGIGVTRFLGYEQDSKVDVASLFQEMADTFRERNLQYKDNWRVVAAVLQALHGKDAACPASDLVDDFEVWHLYELLIVKLTRFANSGLQHKDSIHDIAIYAAMIESILRGR